MVKFYTGDIEGYFWLSAQSSDDAEQFGATRGLTITRYYANDPEACERQLRKLFAELDMQPVFGLSEGEIRSLSDADTTYEPGTDAYRFQQLYASISLGLKIYRCIMAKGSCSFSVERNR